MKKIVILCLIGALLLGLCACVRVSVREDAAVTLHFHCRDVSVDVPLSETEAAQLRDIVDGKALFFDTPSCGFTKDVSFIVNGRTFCPACDKCCYVRDGTSGNYLKLSQAERDLLEQIFEQHGGFFPCN